MNEQLIKQATFIVCPWCDAVKCIGRFNCPAIIEWIERQEKEGDADG